MSCGARSPRCASWSTASNGVAGERPRGYRPRTPDPWPPPALRHPRRDLVRRRSGSVRASACGRTQPSAAQGFVERRRCATDRRPKAVARAASAGGGHRRDAEGPFRQTTGAAGLPRERRRCGERPRNPWIRGGAAGTSTIDRRAGTGAPDGRLADGCRPAGEVVHDGASDDPGSTPDGTGGPHCDAAFPPHRRARSRRVAHTVHAMMTMMTGF